jgi:hypothetical protein
MMGICGFMVGMASHGSLWLMFWMCILVDVHILQYVESMEFVHRDNAVAQLEIQEMHLFVSLMIGILIWAAH